MGGFYLLISLVLRIIFFFHPITTADFSFFEILKVLFIGIINDILVLTLASSFLALYFIFLSNSKYRKPNGYIFLGLLVLAFLYTAFVPNNIFKQYGGSVDIIAMSFIGLKAVLFALLLFLPHKRVQIRIILQ